MRTFTLAAVVAALASTIACKEELKEYCDLSTEAPGVDDGKGSAKGDPEDLDGEASWKPGSAGSLTIGVLDMIIDKEESGSQTQGLVEDGAFPICVRLGERGEKTGAANYVDGGFVTDASHGGSLVIISNEDDVLRGRFQVSLANPGGDELSFTDGEFAATLR